MWELHPSSCCPPAGKRLKSKDYLLMKLFKCILELHVTAIEH